MKTSIAIIGAGLSGTLTTLRILEKAKSAICIYLIEVDDEKCLKGNAYLSKLPYERLNVPVSEMSLFEERPNDFADWLAEKSLSRNKLYATLGTSDFISRNIFAKYLKTRLDETIENAYPGSELRIISKEAIDITYQVKQKQQYKISFKDYSYLYANFVVLATGNLPPTDPNIASKKFFQSTRYTQNPWQASLKKTINSREDVLFLGSGLSAVDWLGSLFREDHKGKIYTLSRNGRLPYVYVKTQGWYLFREGQIPQGLNNLLSYLRKEMKKAEEKGAGWQSVITALRPYSQYIWQSLTQKEQERFLRHLKPFWEIARHRMPIESATMVKNLVITRKLSIIGGHLIDLVEQENGKIKVTYRPKGQKHEEIFLVDKVINCTGVGNLEEKNLPTLFKKAIARGLFRLDKLSLGIDTNSKGQVYTKYDTLLTSLYAIGSLRKGNFWETSSCKEISSQAHQTALKIIEELDKQTAQIFSYS